MVIKMETIVIKPNKETISKIKHFYKHASLPPKNEYVTFFAKDNDCSVLVYTSNKVVFQGKNAQYEASIWQDVPQTASSTKPTSTTTATNIVFPMMGSDEVGTGDFFGPVVVSAVYLDEDEANRIKHHQITDSKMITDDKIMKIYLELKDEIRHHTLILPNEKFNEQTKLGLNMNVIKAKLHNHALKKLYNQVSTPKLIVVDQFCSPKNYYQYLADDEVLNVHLETKAESKYIAVALASVFARATFLIAMDDLTKVAYQPLLKGAGKTVDVQAQEIYDQHGSDIFLKIAKVNFKNYERIIKS